MKKEYDLRSLKKRKGKVKVSAEAAKVPISFRIDGSDLAMLKKRAERLGIGYQTLLGSVIHRFVTDESIDKKTVAMLKKLDEPF